MLLSCAKMFKVSQKRKEKEKVKVRKGDKCTTRTDRLASKSKELYHCSTSTVF